MIAAVPVAVTMLSEPPVIDSALIEMEAFMVPAWSDPALTELIWLAPSVPMVMVAALIEPIWVELIVPLMALALTDEICPEVIEPLIVLA